MVKGVGVGEGSILGHLEPQEGVGLLDKKVVVLPGRGSTVGPESHSTTRKRYPTSLTSQLPQVMVND